MCVRRDGVRNQVGNAKKGEEGSEIFCSVDKAHKETIFFCNRGISIPGLIFGAKGLLIFMDLRK